MNSGPVAMPPASIAASRPASTSISARFAPPDPIGQLVHEQGSRLRRFVGSHVGNRSDADEITQQAFAEMTRCHDSFRGDSKLSTWLYGIALNLIRNHLARAPERRYAFVDSRQLEEHVCPRPDPLAQAELRQTIGLLEQSIQELPADWRQLLHLVCLEEMSYADAATHLGLTVGTVRSRLTRARALLRARMQAHGARLDN